MLRIIISCTLRSAGNLHSWVPLVMALMLTKTLFETMWVFPWLSQLNATMLAKQLRFKHRWPTLSSCRVE